MLLTEIIMNTKEMEAKMFAIIKHYHHSTSMAFRFLAVSNLAATLKIDAREKGFKSFSTTMMFLRKNSLSSTTIRNVTDLHTDNVIFKQFHPQQVLSF